LPRPEQAGKPIGIRRRWVDVGDYIWRRSACSETFGNRMLLPWNSWFLFHRYFYT